MPRYRAISAPPGFLGCTHCREVKPESEFYVKSVDGRPGSYCKGCKLEMRRERRAAMAGKPDPTIAARFWPKVDKRGPDDCWNWLGAKSNRGYGAISYQGADCPAHRVSMQLAGHEVFYPERVVDHRCKNIACVNPAHLRIVTQAENCGPLANPTPHWTNANKTHCKHGHPLSGDNLAVLMALGRPRKDGTRKRRATRACLTCYPRVRNSSFRIA